jgi:hypothetical protein
MRMLTAVLVGLVLFGSAHEVRATDPAEYYACAQKCEKGYDACLARSTGKGPEDCPGTLIRCRGKCDPEWRTMSKRAPVPQTCREQCQSGYDACARTDDGKHGPVCARNVMVCRNACPPEEEAAPVESTAPAEAVPAAANPEAPSAAAAPAPGSAAPAPVSPAPIAPAPVAPASERVAAPEKASAPAAAIDRTGAAPNSIVPERAVSNAPGTGAAPAAAALPEHTLAPVAVAPAGPQGATRPAQPRRSMWERVWCTVAFCGTGATAHKPLSCVETCQQNYDTCFANRNPKRGSGCDTDIMVCRQACQEHKAQ